MWPYNVKNLTWLVDSIFNLSTLTVGGGNPSARAGHSRVPIPQEQSLRVMLARTCPAVQNLEVSTSEPLQGASFLQRKEIRKYLVGVSFIQIDLSRLEGYSYPQK